jgi:hypothetical protein
MLWASSFLFSGRGSWKRRRFSPRMFWIDKHRRLRMRVAVALCAQAQQKRRHDEPDDALLFGGENKFVSEFLPPPTFGEFQRVFCFTRGRTRVDG